MEVMHNYLKKVFIFFIRLTVNNYKKFLYISKVKLHSFTKLLMLSN